MKGEYYKIHINNPCKKEWDSMIQSDNGKYCSKCSTNVVDFTGLTDTQVIQILSGNTEKICGLLTDVQINRTIEIARPKRISSRFYKILSGIFLLSMTGTSFSFGTDIKRQFFSKINSIRSNHLQNSLTDSMKNVVRGLVMDHTKIPLYGVHILIKGTKIKAVTDINGKFQLSIPEELLKRKVTLQILFIGYETKEVAINEKDLPLNEELVAIMVESKFSIGEVIVTPLKKQKD
ncbi:carboxypeptidase-like regulatory domain-containing protein [Daejeonella rubra]|nr:carboxypeptidase-like regulatory domain-containing protein [Daejeonella rubra]